MYPTGDNLIESKMILKKADSDEFVPSYSPN